MRKPQSRVTIDGQQQRDLAIGAVKDSVAAEVHKASPDGPPVTRDRPAGSSQASRPSRR